MNQVQYIKVSPYPLTHSLTHTHLHTHTANYTLVHSFSHSHTPLYSCIHSLTHELIPLTHSLTHPLTHSLTHSPTHPLSHSLTQSQARPAVSSTPAAKFNTHYTRAEMIPTLPLPYSCTHSLRHSSHVTLWHGSGTSTPVAVGDSLARMSCVHCISRLDRIYEQVSE
jgi:hypothetical protein